MGNTSKPIWKSKPGLFLSYVIFLLVPMSMISIVMNWHPLGFADLRVSAGSTPVPLVNILDVVIYGLWAIAPPAWFFVEYVRIFPDALKLDPNQLADMKYTQDLAAKFWAGVLLLLGALLFLKYGAKL